MKFMPGPRQPFVGLVLAAVCGILAADYCEISTFGIWANAAVISIAAFAVLCWPRPIMTYLFVGWSFFLLHSVRTTDTPGLRLATRLGDRPRVITATGAVVSEPKISPNGSAGFLLKLRSIELEGNSESSTATILVKWRGNPQFGDELHLFGAASPVAGPRNPGEFDLRSYLARRDVRQALFVRYEEDGQVVARGGGNPVLRIAQKSRAWLQKILCRDLDDSPEAQSLISGIVLGLRHQTPEDIEEPFQQTGTLHLFAVAGLHVGIVAQLLWMVARVSRLSRQWAAALIIPLLIFYSAITGLHISSIRAAVMATVLLGGFFFERKILRLNSLAAAAMILLCWNTNELFSTGFQLSFSVVGAIILLADPLKHWFRRRTAADPFLPRTLLGRRRRILDSSLGYFGRGASVSMAAWVGSLALLWWCFHLVTPISLAANLAVVPIAFFLLAVALLSILSAPLLPSLSVLFNNANWLLAQLVLAIVHFFAQLPGGHFYFERALWPDGTQAKLSVLDLGAGAAVHLRAANRDWLFDCGSERDYRRIVREYLHSAGVNKLDALVLSHGDSLHIGGAANLVSDWPPSLLVDNPLPDRSTIHQRLRNFFQRSRLIVAKPAAGERIRISPQITALILHPSRLSLAHQTDDQTFVIQLQIGESAHVLLMSDSGVETENTLLHSGLDLQSDIIIKGQHRSGISGSPEFLAAVRPRLIIATSRDFPEHERITDDWAEWARRGGAKLFRQDETGAVELRFWPASWEARAYVTGEIFRSSTR